MGARDLGALVLLGAIWGSSFLFIRVAVPALGPFVLMELRVGLAAAALALLAVAVGRSLHQASFRGYSAAGARDRVADRGRDASGSPGYRERPG